MEENNEARIGRMLSGAAGSDERMVFESELATNPSLNQDFHIYQKIWENSHLDKQDQWPADQAWAKFSKNASEAPVISLSSRRVNLRWAVAAAIIIGLGSMLFYRNTGSAITYSYNEKDTKPLELADGSKIYLNRGASVDVFPFKHTKRRVSLKGEAFFEVSPDPKRPFTVESGGTISEVVGTAFNIRQTEEGIKIFVQKGKVIFKSVDFNTEALALTAGEAAFFDDKRMQLIPNPSPNINAWHTQHLSFTKNMTYAEMLADASSYFGHLIKLENPALKDCRISSTLIYNDPEINAVLKPLASFINGTIKINGNTYIILGGNCP